jgi:hypothetical protein
MKNLLVRGQIQEQVKQHASLYAPYTVEDDQRIEHIAHDYYEDVHADWMIYFANDVVDPFYGVHLGEDNFKNFVKKKYGSLVTAINQIQFYRNAWYGDSAELTLAGYEDLPSGSKKYYKPILGYVGNVIGYERTKRDYTYATNVIEALSLTTPLVDEAFVVGENIVIDTDNKATLVWANTSYIVYKHVIGSFVSNTNYTITGSTSGVAGVANAETVTVLKQVIPEAEVVYFEAVTAFDEEQEKNEAHRNISLIDNGFKGQMDAELKRLFT